jgi:hypothetical protein
MRDRYLFVYLMKDYPEGVSWMSLDLRVSKIGCKPAEESGGGQEHQSCDN